MTKRKMKQESCRISLYDLEGSIESVRDLLDGYIERYGASATLA